jgi:hypothetical protein
MKPGLRSVGGVDVAPPASPPHSRHFWAVEDLFGRRRLRRSREIALTDTLVLLTRESTKLQVDRSLSGSTVGPQATNSN